MAANKGGQKSRLPRFFSTVGKAKPFLPSLTIELK
jgi:hypothetical protein